MNGASAAAASAANPVGTTLDGALVRGIAWTGGMKWLAQGLTWASTLIVARILTPEDYGLVAMASVYMGVVTLVSEFGLGAAVIQMRELTSRQIAQLNGLSVLLGAAAFALSCGAAIPLGAFFRAPQLPAVVVVLGVTFVVTGFRVVPAALLNRDLRFRTLALIDGARAALMAAVMVVFAVLGFRYWTLVFGAVSSSVLYTLMTLSRRRHALAWPRRGEIGPAISFSSDVLGSRLAWYLYSTADFLVAGRLLGKSALGAYSMAWTLASVPVEKVTTLVMKVTPALFAAAQEDLAALRRYLVLLTQGISLLTLPAAFGLALVADDFIRVVLGEKWLAAVLPLRLLAAYAAVRSVSPLFPPVMNALGRTREVLWNNVLALLLLPAAFVVGGRWGTGGIAAAWLIVHPLVVVSIARRTLAAIDLPLSRYLASLWPALSAVLPMIGVVLVIRAVFPEALGPALRLVVEVAAGALVYGTVLVVWHRERVRSFRTVLLQLRGPRTVP